MALYLIYVKDPDHVRYDCYDSVVVRARSEKQARQLLKDKGFGGGETRHANPNGSYGRNLDFWSNPRYTVCERIDVSGETEIIISSFNAG